MFKHRSAPMIALSAMAVIQPATPAMAGVLQSRIYPAPTTPLGLKGLPDTTTLIEVKTADGLVLKGLEVAPRDGRPVLLLLHGNGSSAADAVRWFAPLIERGYGIVAAEYRGYSANPGKPDEPGLAADADAFYARARTLAGTARLIVVGHSLGAGVAFGLAMREKLDALVTIGAFTRLKAMMPKIARGFVSDEYDNLADVPKLDEPWFLLHGLRDATVPASEGNALHNAAVRADRDGASFVLTDADHHPDGKLIATVIDTFEARLEGAAWPTDLPPQIGIFPFTAR